jgi:hypothetical protein
MNASSNWIMNKPESLTILMLMGTGIASLAFTTFSISMAFRGIWFLAVLFAFFVWGSTKQFIKIYKLTKSIGLKNALGGFTAREFVWKRNKLGGKINDKCNRTIKADEICSEQDEGISGISKKGDGTNNNKSERTNAWSRIMLEGTDGNIKKARDDRRGNS